MSYPEWNTAPIKCGSRKCKWTGKEGDLKGVRDPDPNPLGTTTNSCPSCGCKTYTFIKPKG